MPQKLPERNIRTGKPNFSVSSLREEVLLSKIVHKIGHEIGNPLTSIISLATVIERCSAEEQSPGFGKLQTYAQAMSREAWRVTAITEKVVLLLSDREGIPSRCNLEKILKKTVTKLRGKPEHANIATTLELDGTDIFADYDQVAWVLQALLENAFLAQTAEQQPPPIIVSVKPNEGETEVTVTNIRKSSIPLELDSLFDPFTVENPLERRLGLGLTVSHAILARMKGSIELREEPVDGGFAVSATIRLPGSAAGLASSSEPRATKSVQRWQKRIETIRGPLKVIIVEDDPSVASAIDKILHLTFAARKDFSTQQLRPQDFLDRVNAGETFRAVLCDLNLGDVSGRHLYESYCAKSAAAPEHFAFLTGDLARHESSIYLDSCGCRHLAKPFEPEELIELTLTLLEA